LSLESPRGVCTTQLSTIVEENINRVDVLSHSRLLEAGALLSGKSESFCRVGLAFESQEDGVSAAKEIPTVMLITHKMTIVSQTFGLNTLFSIANFNQQYSMLLLITQAYAVITSRLWGSMRL
jgi:hypothetical protein